MTSATWRESAVIWIDYALVALLVGGLLCSYLWWRATAREHYSAVHYAMAILLDPERYAAERQFLLSQVAKRQESTPAQLSVAMFSGLSVHATRIFSKDGTESNQDALWRIYQAAPKS